jgi:hypothetical protein
LFTFNIKKEVHGILDSFLSFLRNFEERKAHNMFSLKLDPRFKNFRLVSSFVGCEQGIFVEEYDQKSLKPMFLKCYHHLHLMQNYDIESTKHRSYENNNLDIFKMIANKNELVTELVNKKFLIIKKFQVDPKEIECPMQWWQKHESMFHTIGFFA